MILKVLAAAASLAAMDGPVAAAAVAMEQSVDVGVPACAPIYSGRKAKLLTKGVTYFLMATFLEDQGRHNLRPNFEPPEKPCKMESFVVGESKVDVTYNEFQKGMLTLLYKVGVGDSREILVTYSGMLAFTDGGERFAVTETQGDKVDIYAIYDREPPYSQVRTLLEGILSGGESPLLSAEWQEGKDELIITEFDDRLK